MESKAPNNRIPVERLINLLGSDGRAVILCGAGVSMPAPSCSPSGNELRDLCVRVLVEDERTRTILAEIMETTAYRGLLPELVLQDIASFAPDQLDRLVARAFQHVRPNPVHRAIAARFNWIFTTNFDLCLERAGASSVQHLHGSIRNLDSLQNRLFRLGNKATQEAASFVDLARTRRLVVLGYSFRDSDIIRLVEAACPSEVVYLSYDGTVPLWFRSSSTPWVYAVGSVESVLGLTHSQRSRISRSSAPKAKVRKASIGARVNILLYLCLRTGLYGLADAILEGHLGQLRGRLRYKALSNAANLMRLAGRFEDSRRLCRRTLDNPSVKREENADSMSALAVITGLCFLDEGRGNYREIEHLFIEGLRLANVYAQYGKSRHPTDAYLVGGVIWKARILNNLGYLYATEGEHRKALRAYKDALEIKRRYSEEVGVAQTEVNMAVSLLHLGVAGEAAEYLEDALRCMQKTPDFYVCRDALFYVLRAIPKVRDTIPGDCVLEGFQPIDDRAWRSVRRQLINSGDANMRILLDHLEEFRRILARIGWASPA